MCVCVRVCVYVCMCVYALYAVNLEAYCPSFWWLISTVCEPNPEDYNDKTGHIQILMLILPVLLTSRWVCLSAYSS